MSYHPSLPYEYHLPPQPRLTIPPPDVNYPTRWPPTNSTTPSPNPLTATVHPRPSAAAAYLPTLQPQSYVLSSARLDWSYTDRRRAQPILPFLYLGPFPAAKDAAFLRQAGITMVVAVRSASSAQANLLTSTVARGLGIEAASVDVHGNQELIAAFPRATALINAHLRRLHQNPRSRSSSVLQNGGGGGGGGGQETNGMMGSTTTTTTTTTPGKVLLYCESGNERSAAVAAAYVMDMYATDVVHAIQLVSNQRFCVALDDETKTFLWNYADLLLAQRDVARSRGVTPTPTVEVGGGEGGGGLGNGLGNGMGIGNGNGHAGDFSMRLVRDVSNGSSAAPKRRIEHVRDEGDEEMDGGGEGNMDGARFERRAGFAPFVEGLGGD